MPGNSLGAFLKAMRQRIDRDLDRLGDYERLPGRRGRVVSQEELAEAVEVNRGWYGLLEWARRCARPRDCCLASPTL